MAKSMAELKERQKANRLKKIEEAAYKWYDGQIDDRRLAEIVFGLINEEVKGNE